MYTISRSGPNVKSGMPDSVIITAFSAIEKTVTHPSANHLERCLTFKIVQELTPRVDP